METSVFDLNTWQTGNNGEWRHWAAVNGRFQETTGSAPNCLTVSTLENKRELPIRFYPNPTSDTLFIESPLAIVSVQVHDLKGKSIYQSKIGSSRKIVVPFQDFASGTYTILVKTQEGGYTGRVIYKH